MIQKVILDTGPLVAFLKQDDRHHAWSVQRFREIACPLVTCEAVISEACFLLRHHPVGIEKIAAFLAHGDLVVEFSLAAHHRRVFALMQAYRGVPMSLADACLVCMVEEGASRKLFTLDSDFTVYRQHRHQPIPLIIP